MNVCVCVTICIHMYVCVCVRVWVNHQAVDKTSWVSSLHLMVLSFLVKMWKVLHQYSHIGGTIFTVHPYMYMLYMLCAHICVYFSFLLLWLFLPQPFSWSNWIINACMNICTSFISVLCNLLHNSHGVEFEG